MRKFCTGSWYILKASQQAMALLKSLPLPLGSPMIDFSLPDTGGKIHRSRDYTEAKVLVIIFMCNHCPYVQAVLERLIELQACYDHQEVRLIGINANNWEAYPEDSPEEMKKMISGRGVNFPYLYDETQEVAREYQAQCTPDIFVFDQGRTLAYHGRIDDNWKDPIKVKNKELKHAIDTILGGKKPREEQYPSIGCSIKWRS